MGDVSAYLPVALKQQGVNVALFTLGYDNVNKDNFEHIGGFEMWIYSTKMYVEIFRGDLQGVPVYFLKDNCGYAGRIYEGDLLRQAILLSDGTFKAKEYLCGRRLLGRPDVMYGNDWPAALVPTYLKTKFNTHPLFNNTAGVFGIHNLFHQGLFPGYRFAELGIEDKHWFGLACNRNPHEFRLVKGAIVHPEKIITVSERYAREIQTPEYGEGLDGLLRDRAWDVVGIVNGINIDKTQVDDSNNRNAHKKKLQEEFSLEINYDVPLLAMSTSRIASQKNNLMVLEVIERLLIETGGRIQFILTGKGHPSDNYFSQVESFAQKLSNNTNWNGRVAFRFVSSDFKLSQMIYKGADIFLMPSKFEPCGLAQLVALAFGCIPIVRYTGGLADTVREFNAYNNTGNGFLFGPDNAGDLHCAVLKALNIFQNKPLWSTIIRNAQSEDRSWDKSAAKYIQVFEWAIEKKLSSASSGIIGRNNRLIFGALVSIVGMQRTVSSAIAKLNEENKLRVINDKTVLEDTYRF
ncbi:MAG: glycogen synthase, partial [Nitrospirae bacterium]|nr:glycogen synthase [Nitrospirota bacterium]